MSESAEVESVVRGLLDAMRNAHMRLIQDDAGGAMAYANEAKHLHNRLTSLFEANPANRAEAGHVMCEVIGQRCQGLLSLAREALTSPQSPEKLAAFVSAPSSPVATKPKK